MISRCTLLVLVVVCLATAEISAQVLPDSVSTDSLAIDTPTPDSLLNAETLRDVSLPEEKLPENIIPWKQFTPASFSQVSNDSLLRWQVWPNWGDYYAYRHDVLSFRQGTIGRVDAFQISGYNPYEQSLTLDGIDLSNPITGLINYNYVPHSKIGEVIEQKMIRYQSEVRLKRYYLVEPLSYMNYDEAKFNYRNLEFSVAQNFTERTNLELSFWDRRDGDSYPRNDVLGNQIVARGYHYLKPNLQLRSLFLRNQFELQEPFGYVVSDPLAFSFDRFASSANVSNAESKTTRRDWLIGLYQRQDTNSVETRGIEFVASKDDFSLPASSRDTLSWDIRNYTLSAFNINKVGNLEIKLKASGSYFRRASGTTISRDDWWIGNVSPQLTYYLSPKFSVSTQGKATFRSDSFSGVELGGELQFLPTSRSSLSMGAGTYSRMPTIQHLYWNGKNYSGTSSLENETGISMFGDLEVKFSDRISVGISGRLNQSQNRTILNTDSTFINDGNVTGISGTIFGKFSNYRYEFESSVTFDALGATDTLASNDYNEQKIWFRNSAFIKGYMFDRATYVKLGVRTILSPLTYGSKYFNTELQYWQANSSESDIAAFFRLDAELSARIRAMMVVIRWENALDGVGQLGYFESATYPMPARRLLFGIRAQFRN
ncbi:MAG: hypothetical protein ED557_13735 [Balneola sp.]|nr:MAG: hypothetical protein ED557_13735 [Balneola sp.]